jgi:hypothetical protein
MQERGIRNGEKRGRHSDSKGNYQDDSHFLASMITCFLPQWP